MHVLFVCLGNICRSPLAEAVARQIVPDWTCDSAGTSDWHVGNAPYAPMRATGEAAGYCMSDLRARQFQRADFTRFDLIVAMDQQNLQDIERLRPVGNMTPVHKLRDWDTGGGGASGADVPDPYYTRDFENALTIVERAVKGLVAAKSKKQG